MVSFKPHMPNIAIHKPHFANPMNVLAGEEVISDEDAIANKSKIMKTLRWSSGLSSISTVAALVGGPLVAAGVMSVANAVLGTAEVATAGALAGIGGVPAVAMLGVGALFVGASVASHYMASRIYQSKNFDNLEVTAKSTAKHIAEEMQKVQQPLAVNVEVGHDNQRADGKKWTQVIDEQRGIQRQQEAQV
ncbi:MAG: hypothetical protein ACN2B6_04265 [Rickettsiales bacterium]